MLKPQIGCIVKCPQKPISEHLNLTILLQEQSGIFATLGPVYTCTQLHKPVKYLTI